MTLLEPAKYFPADGNKFEVGPRLKTLGTDFGNGPRDGFLIQFDTEFPRFRKNKLACRSERLGKFVATARLDLAVEKAANQLLLDRLTYEHPTLFSKRVSASGEIELLCSLTQETLVFDSDLRLLEAKNSLANPRYVSAFDALSCQLQEDIAVTQRDSSNSDWVSALHLCAPSHWGAEDKIGKDFRVVHEPVPGIEKMNRTAPQLVDASIKKGPYTRLVFVFSKDNRLNHHTEPSPGFDLDTWRGWDLDFTTECPFYLRVERQVVWGLPDVNAFLFSIHIFFTSGADIRANAKLRENISATMRTMALANLQYKGLKVPPEELMAWIAS